MRAFLHLMNRQLGRDTKGRFVRARSQYAAASSGFIVMRIPARPFIRPVVETHFKPDDVKARFMARVGVLMLGDFGQLGTAIPR